MRVRRRLPHMSDFVNVTGSCKIAPAAACQISPLPFPPTGVKSQSNLGLGFEEPQQSAVKVSPAARR
jgi:hypothetical protein